MKTQKQLNDEFDAKISQYKLNDYFCGYCFLNQAGLFRRKDVYFFISGISTNTQYDTIAQQVLAENKIKFCTGSKFFEYKSNPNFAFDKFIIHQKYREDIIKVQKEILDRTLLIYSNEFFPALIDFQKLINKISLCEKSLNQQKQKMEEYNDENSNSTGSI